MEPNIKPDTSWMRQKYNEFNQQYFNGELPPCHFKTFTTGKGCEGGVLGWFSLSNAKSSKEINGNKLYRPGFMPGEVSYYIYGREYIPITPKNIFKLCHPTIMLNANYSWNEFSMSETLLHEMCHYAVYIRNGCCRPARTHGAEFMAVARDVVSKTGGKFTVKGVATAETMKNVQLDQKFVEKKKQRLDNKVNTSSIILMKRAQENDYVMFIGSNLNCILFTHYYKAPSRKYPFVKTIKDKNILRTLFEKGYHKQNGKGYYILTKYPKIQQMLMDADGEIKEYTKNESLKHKINAAVKSTLNEHLIRENYHGHIYHQ